MRLQCLGVRLGLVDGTPLSELDFVRLKAKQAPDAAAERVAVEWRRPSLNWRQTLGWTSFAVARELKTWQAALPGLLRGDFVFTLMLWVAVFTVAAAIVATPSLPLSARYAAGLAAVGYLFLCVELTRIRRPVPGRQWLLAAADVAVVMALGALSVGYVPYGRVLLFFAAVRLAARFRDPRVLAVGLLLLVPFEVAGHPSPLSLLMDAFLMLMTMWLVVYLTTAADRAQQGVARQTALAVVTSGLARVRDGWPGAGARPDLRLGLLEQRSDDR